MPYTIKCPVLGDTSSKDRDVQGQLLNKLLKLPGTRKMSLRTLSPTGI